MSFFSALQRRPATIAPWIDNLSIPRPLPLLPATMAGYCAEYGDGLSLGGYCSSFVAADSMVFVAEKFADVREYEASLQILARFFFRLAHCKLINSKVVLDLFIHSI
jgi:hypothetical protein